MNPHARKVLQGVVGIGLAWALLWWGLPYFAKTTWLDIGAVISSCLLYTSRWV